MEDSNMQGGGDPQEHPSEGSTRKKVSREQTLKHRVKDTNYKCDNCGCGFILLEELKQHSKTCEPVLKVPKKRPRGRPRKVQQEPKPSFEKDSVDSIQQPTGKSQNIQKEPKTTCKTVDSTKEPVQNEPEPTFDKDSHHPTGRQQNIQKEPKTTCKTVDSTKEPVQKEPEPTLDTYSHQPTGRQQNSQKEPKPAFRTETASSIKRPRGRPRKVQKVHETETEIIGSMEQPSGSPKVALNESKASCKGDTISIQQLRGKPQSAQKKRKSPFETEPVGGNKKASCTDLKIKNLYLKPLVRNSIQCSICPFTSDSITLVTTHYLNKHALLVGGYNAAATTVHSRYTARGKGLFKLKQHVENSKPTDLSEEPVSDIENDLDDSDDYCADPDFAPTKTRPKTNKSKVNRKTSSFTDSDDDTCSDFGSEGSNLSRNSTIINQGGAIIHKRLSAVTVGTHRHSILMKTITNIKYKYDCIDRRRHLLMAKNGRRLISTDKDNPDMNINDSDILNSANSSDISKHIEENVFSEDNHVSDNTGKDIPPASENNSVADELRRVEQHEGDQHGSDKHEVVLKGNENTTSDANSTDDNTNLRCDLNENIEASSVSSGVQKAVLSNINSQMSSSADGSMGPSHAESSSPSRFSLRSMFSKGSKEQACATATSQPSVVQGQQSPPLCCDKCSITFSNTTVYVLHRGFHSPGAMFRCSLCLMDLVGKVEFSEHISNHKLG